jgi:hypothetical protein
MRDTIDMAREAGARLDKHNGGFIDQSVLLRFADLVRADEREACAKECKVDRTSADIEIAIRNRGNT